MGYYLEMLYVAGLLLMAAGFWLGTGLWRRWSRAGASGRSRS
jgi:hypothetical protein